MSKIKTTPQMMGRLDPEWDKHKRNAYLRKIADNIMILAAVLGLFAAFAVYKGLEKKQKQDNINKQQHYDSIR